MPSLPRIITVDPLGNVARTIRAAIDMSAYACRQIDVPSGAEALEELQLGGSNLVVTALNLEDMRAFDLTAQIKDLRPETAIMVFAEEDDPEMDEEEQREHGFVYFQRPLDVQRFSNVLFAGMKGDDIFEALHKPTGGGTGTANTDYGPVPTLDLDKASNIVDALLTDLGAMSILLLARDGNVLLERGTANYVERDALTQAIIPSILGHIDMKEIVGGDATALQFYDGDQRDVYTLSVGLHHMLCIVYDGEKGQREFGAVNRFGRKATLDLIPLIGPEAFFVRKVETETKQPDEASLPRRTMPVARVQPQEDEQLMRAEEFAETPAGTDLEEIHFEAIDDTVFNPELFDELESLDLSAAEDLFSLDNLEGMSLNVKSTRTISDEDARQLGILGNE